MSDDDHVCRQTYGVYHSEILYLQHHGDITHDIGRTTTNLLPHGVAQENVAVVRRRTSGSRIQKLCRRMQNTTWHETRALASYT